MRVGLIAEAVRASIADAATTLRADVRDALERARVTERSERGRAVLGQLIENAAIAERDHVPLCQDTGTVWVGVELGPEVLDGAPDGVRGARAERAQGRRGQHVAQLLEEPDVALATIAGDASVENVLHLPESFTAR